MLWDYQEEGAQFLITRRGAILGDAVGLGKTRQAITAALWLKSSRRHILVICPKVLKRWWVDEIVRVMEENNVHGVSVREISGVRDTPEIIAKEPTVRWVIGHYEQFNDRSRVRDWFKQQYWTVVIVDEVHNIAKRSQRTKGISSLSSDYRWGLTGTPIADRPADLWGLLHWIAPRSFTSKWAFLRMWFDVYVDQWGAWRVGELLNPIAFRKAIESYLLVRRHEDVSIPMPEEPLVQRIPLEMPPKQQALYQRLEDSAVVELEGMDGEVYQVFITNAVARFTHLHRCASHPQEDGIESAKMLWFRDYLDNGGAPAVIMSRYNATVDAIKAALQQSGRSDVDQFVVGTYARLSHGHNLQHLHTLILWDSTYSRLEHEQAIGRVHRQGQKRRVHVIELECVGTVDRHMFNVIKRKEDHVFAVLRWLRKRCPGALIKYGDEKEVVQCLEENS